MLLKYFFGRHVFYFFGRWVGWGGGGVEKLRLKLTSAKVEVEVEVELGKKHQIFLRRKGTIGMKFAH